MKHSCRTHEQKRPFAGGESPTHPTQRSWRLGGRIVAAVVLALLLGAPGSAPARGSDNVSARTRAFLAAIAAYDRNAYDEAAAGFERLVRAGAPSAKLYYDLGNSYLKNGNLGRAILWYERARRLAPRDPDLAYNLAYARKLTVDRAEDGGLRWGELLFFWSAVLGDGALRWAAVVANALFWGVLAVRRFRPRRGWSYAASVVGGLTLLLLATVGYRALVARHDRAAVVVTPEVAVRAGLSDDTTELFLLHAGATVDLDRIEGDRARIRFSRGKIGWVPRGAVQPIRKVEQP